MARAGEHEQPLPREAQQPRDGGVGDRATRSERERRPSAQQPRPGSTSAHSASGTASDDAIAGDVPVQQGTLVKRDGREDRRARAG